MNVFDWLFGFPTNLPIGHCLAWHPGLVNLRAVADVLIAICLATFALGVMWHLRRRPNMLHKQRALLASLSALAIAAIVSQLLGAVSIWYPVHGLDALARVATAIFSGVVLAVLWPILPSLVRLPSSQQLAGVNERLRREAEAHEITLRELEAARSELESRVVERTKELSLVKARFETALRGAKIYLFSQDRDLRYTWVYSPTEQSAAAAMVGRTDAEIGGSDLGAVVARKKKVLDTGQSADFEVPYVLPDRGALYALHVDPTYDADGQIDGIMCAAIDISRLRLLETEQRRLTEELAIALQRYEIALRGSHVTVFTQDRRLRYTSVSSPMFGRTVEEIVGRTDEELLSESEFEPILALKREVLETARPMDGEFKVQIGETARWYDFHVEPLREFTGSIVGLTCAAVDVTHRKASEAHLRELMRELTHRSKNLLAVIQAMARQTARHSGTIDGFLDQFGARLHALAASHDLLVQEGWYGASLAELVRSQLSYQVDRDASQLSVQGPSLLLKPEAAQSLGLAIHELAANAARYGALSEPGGRVSVSWQLMEADGSVELVWQEAGGPQVRPPNQRGFGSLAIERNLSRALDAEVDLSFEPEGVRCRIHIPASNLTAGQ